MSEKKNYNSNLYNYTGPTVMVEIVENKGKRKGEHSMLLLPKGNEVMAEVNINVATITDYHCGDWYKLVNPIDVAAKYLEPVKRTIHFDPKDDVDVPHFFDNLFSDIAKINAEHYMPFFNDMAFSNKTMIDKWAEEHRQDIENNDAKMKQWEKIKNEDLDNLRVRDYIFGSGKENIEVGGQHYQTAIQPWDFIYANHIPFDEANCIKYLCRHKDKGGAEDIKKVISYCKHILKTQYNEDD